MRRRARPAATAVGVDTGGTFTDFVAVVSDRLVAFKVPSTPRAPERAVIEGLARAGADRWSRVRHGSTVATNTLLERKGARVALVTNAGFEDLIEIARQERPQLYAIAPSRPPPLVPRERRMGVRVRRDERGRSLVPLSRAEVARVVARLRRLRPEAIAIGFLHAYAAPTDERRLARALRVLGVPVSASSELCPEVREYERFATTVANAYLQPRVGRYLEALARAHGPRLEIVLSHGRCVPAREAIREPVRQLLSGPAAGLWAARDAAGQAGFGPMMTLDVGGTSTDVAFATGAPPRRRARDVAGLPILLPMLDVHTIGAGGGSIAEVDAGGLLAVGPRSAGADPGPACYGRGGPATVTDALLLLGRLPPMTLGDGAITLDLKRAEAALRALARRIGVGSALAAARAVVDVVNASMVGALRRVSVERGHDPRGAVLVAFGGAGGLHACELAEALGARAVLFPRHAGMLSALGALGAAEGYERSRSVLLPARETRAVAREIDRLQQAVDRRFRRSGKRVARRSVLARYAGQSHELEIPFGPGLERRFHEEHRRRFGFAREEAPVEIVTVEVQGAIGPGDLPAVWRAGRPESPRAGARGRAWVRGAWRSVPIRSLESLGSGARVRGPAIVLGNGATLWIEPGWVARLHRSGSLVVSRGAR